MIEVVLSNGDSANAPDPASAVAAAHALMREAADAGAASALLRASFYVAGELVRCDVRVAEVAACLLKAPTEGSE